MITAVVSVYNTGQYLPKAIDSLLSQTYDNYEIIIVDDGSDDGSGQICDQQSARSNRITVYHKANGGLSSARNYGIEKARGDWIIFPDPDDWVEPDYLEHLVSLRDSCDADLSICGFIEHNGGKTITYDKNTALRVMNKEESLEFVMMPDSFCGFAWNKLYSIDVIKHNHLHFDLELGMAQDLHFAVRYLTCCDRIVYDPRPLYHYSKDNGGVTSMKTPLTQRKLSGLKTYEKIAEITKGQYPKIAATAYYTLVDTCMQYLHIYYRSGMKCPSVLKQICGIIKKYRKYYTNERIYDSLYRKNVWLASVNPGLYYFLFRVRRYIISQVQRINRKKGD